MKTFEPITCTLQITQVGDHLRVYLPEIDTTVETPAGKTSYDDALDVAHTAMEQYALKASERVHAL